jgi:hypothetical protein
MASPHHPIAGFQRNVGAAGCRKRELAQDKPMSEAHFVGLGALPFGPCLASGYKTHSLQSILLLCSPRLDHQRTSQHPALNIKTVFSPLIVNCWRAFDGSISTSAPPKLSLPSQPPENTHKTQAQLLLSNFHWISRWMR